MKKLALFVLYNPNIDFLNKTLYLVNKEVEKIWISDNSPVNHEALINCKGVEYRHLPYNSGIAHAQNLGIRYAIENDYNWIIFFDQDSTVPSGFVKELLSSFITILSCERNIYGIGPSAINRDSKVVLNKKSMLSDLIVENHMYTQVRELMCSGSIIRTELFKAVGLMDESLFIDGVDFEICWRGKSKIGALFYIDQELVLEHQLGEGDKKLFGRNTHISSPFRTFYQIRNSLILSRRKYVPLKWKVLELMKSIIKSFLYPLLLSPRYDYFNAVVRGYREGLTNR